MSCLSNFGRLSLLAALLIPALVNAEPKTAVADNGREVILKDNGEWEYKSKDIYATTTDGQRVRLSPNNQWRPVSKTEAPAPAPTQVIIQQQVPETTVRRDTVALAKFDSRLTLDTVVIETQRESVGKNTRKRSNLVFYLDLDSKASLPRPGQITVQDSKGRTYPVFSVERGSAKIGSAPRVIVRANGAPRWWGVKFFAMTIAPGALGNTAAIELRKSMDEVMREEVSKLPENDL